MYLQNVKEFQQINRIYKKKKMKIEKLKMGKIRNSINGFKGRWYIVEGIKMENKFGENFHIK